MPNEVVDQHGPAAHPQTFAHKLSQLLSIQMMGKKAATHQVEGSVAERQGKRIGHHAVTFTEATISFAISCSAIPLR